MPSPTLAIAPQPDVSAVDTLLVELGDRIRKGRERANLTLLQLAERSGVAPSTIQKIESRQMTPSIVVLCKIATGLGMEIGDLIAARTDVALDVAVQYAGRHAVMITSENLKSEKLSADLGNTELECWRVTMAPGHHSEFDPPQTMSEQVLVCEAGVLELDLGDGPFRLSAGDTLHYRRRSLRTFRNPGSATAVYLTICFTRSTR